ncbi:MAG: cytochrome B6, partial [Planctomycetota bacterium]
MEVKKKQIAFIRTLMWALIVIVALSCARAANSVPSSYSPVVITEDFDSIMARMKAAKPEVMKRQMEL